MSLHIFYMNFIDIFCRKYAKIKKTQELYRRKSLVIAVFKRRGAKSFSIQCMSEDAAKCKVPLISHVLAILRLAIASSTSFTVVPSLHLRPIAHNEAG